MCFDVAYTVCVSTISVMMDYTDFESRKRCY